MDRTVKPGGRSGIVTAPASKSQLHRLFICAALAERKCEIFCNALPEDILATVRCLRSMGADIAVGSAVSVRPIADAPSYAHLDCGESGSTLRFLLPVAAALGISADILMSGRLPERPIQPILDELETHGVKTERSGSHIRISGRLKCGEFSVPGDISSQFVSGLLFALPLVEGESTLTVTGKTESADYIAMTEDALRRSGIAFEKRSNLYIISGRRRYSVPDVITPEGDYSGAAPFLCMGALSERGVTVRGLNTGSVQGDRRIQDILIKFGADVASSGEAVTVRRGKLCGITVDASDIPDLVPCLCALACGAEGRSVITGASRLRMKETDRLRTTYSMLKKLGADIYARDDGFEIIGTGRLSGGETDTFGDHRIAMAAAVASCICGRDTVIRGGECVGKSYPGFWDDLAALEVEK